MVIAVVLVDDMGMIKRSEVALEIFLWGLEVFSRRDCGLILSGYRVCDADRRLDRLLERFKQQQWLEQQGRGKAATFTITETGRQRLRVVRPAEQWDKPWDGRWRVFLFDLPAQRGKERMVLWRALRDAKMGLLQRSVWIWPQPVTKLFEQVVHAHSIPECFCGFEAGQLFLCSDAEVVASAWDQTAIAHAHETYLKHLVATTASVRRAPNLHELATVARIERDAYQFAFRMDPLLPRQLWPKTYRGAQVENRHQAFLAELRRCAPQWLTP